MTLRTTIYKAARRGWRKWYRAYLRADLRRQRERKIQISERAYENLF